MFRKLCSSVLLQNDKKNSGNFAMFMKNIFYEFRFTGSTINRRHFLTTLPTPPVDYSRWIKNFHHQVKARNPKFCISNFIFMSFKSSHFFHLFLSVSSFKSLIVFRTPLFTYFPCLSSFNFLCWSVFCVSWSSRRIDTEFIPLGAWSFA